MPTPSDEMADGYTTHSNEIITKTMPTTSNAIVLPGLEFSRVIAHSSPFFPNQKTDGNHC